MATVSQVVEQLVRCEVAVSALLRVIDSHTEGEPTRVVIDGGPDLGTGSLADRRALLADKFDAFRTTLILEPRGSDALVGALLCEPNDLSCVAGVIFFNNAGYLGMCGHGLIGVAVTLAYLGRISAGCHKVETPVGIVEIELLGPNEVRIENVASYCYLRDITIEVDGLGSVSGQVAWGGNWFFLVDNTSASLTLDNVRALTDITQKIQRALAAQDITGANGEEIDHIELFGPPQSADANSRNFVLCPGGAYDRSPCGTGTSAKLACLAAADKLEPGDTWIQESIIGSRFIACYRIDGEGQVIPSVTGHAYICGETTLIQQEGDPFVHGIHG
jgi:4-hydroxyproline epimerase